VTEQDGGGAVLDGRHIQRAIPGRPGRGLWPRGRARRRHRDAAYRVEPELAEQRRDAAGALTGTRLQPVVDGHTASSQAKPRRHEGRGRGQRERVRAAGTRDEHQVAGGQVAKTGPDRVADLGDRHARTHAG